MQIMATSSRSGIEAGSSSHSSSSSAVTSNDEGPSTVSFVDKLKAPKLSEFSRKRALNRNPPPKGKR